MYTKDVGIEEDARARAMAGDSWSWNTSEDATFISTRVIFPSISGKWTKRPQAKIEGNEIESLEHFHL